MTTLQSNNSYVKDNVQATLSFNNHVYDWAGYYYTHYNCLGVINIIIIIIIITIKIIVISLLLSLQLFREVCNGLRLGPPTEHVDKTIRRLSLIADNIRKC